MTSLNLVAVLWILRLSLILTTPRKKEYFQYVKLQFYSRNYYVEKNKICFINSGLIIGEKKNKEAFFKDLKKSKQIKEIEINGDFFISVYSEEKTKARVEALKTVYNQRITFLKPVIIDEEGLDEWEAASFNRKDIEKIIT